MISKSIKINHILKGEKRFDGKFFLNNNALLSLIMEENEDKCLPLTEFAIAFNPPVFKRQFCQNTDTAIQYFQSSDVPSVNESSDVFINRTQADKVKAIVKENQILITGFGSIGNISLVSSIQNGAAAYANNTCRVEAKENQKHGYIYAALASKYGNAQMNKNASGSVVRYIEAPGIKKTLIPNISLSKQELIHNIINESCILRVESNKLLEKAKEDLLLFANLKKLSIVDYNYFGPRAFREQSYFTKNINDIDSTTINAFNHSNRIEKTIQRIKASTDTQTLNEVLDEKKLFSTGSFPRVEVKSEKSIMLINQSNIFDKIIRGKRISRRKVKVDNLAQYGEILIAGVGTLGESESFCRVIFVNEDIQGQLISGEFIRMNVNENIPAGYLYAWLNTDYGFRLIRSTQTGTKLCRPIQRLLLNMPVPILESEKMNEIHNMVTKAHTLRFQANQKEKLAIQLVENEIEQWQN